MTETNAPEQQAEWGARRAAPASAVGRRRPWRLALAILALAAAVAGAALYWTLGADGATRFVTRKVTRGPVTRKVTASGAINPVITVQIGSYVSGVIQARYCDYNTRVVKGQLCAKIDPRPYQIVVDQNKASLAVARAQLAKDKAGLAYARINYERSRRLAATKAVSPDVVDNAKSVYDQAQAQVGLDEAMVAQREAELRAAEINLGYTGIISPVDGTVVSRSVETGQTVAASFQTPTLFLIAEDLTAMQVDTNVSESDIGEVKLGDKASFTVESFPKRVFHGEVTQVRQSPQTIQNVVTYDAVISAPNRDGLLKPGMTATARITVDERKDVLRVADQAFRYAPGGLATLSASGEVPEGRARLWVLRDGRPQPVVVLPGLDDDAFTEIVEGEIRVGDEVIIGEEETAESPRPPARASSRR